MSLTKWEVGQELIKCADVLGEAESECEGAGYKDLAEVLRKCRLEIGFHFNKLGSHDFGLEGRKP